MSGATPPLVVLDDDPTGTQAVANVPVVLDWSRGALGRVLVERPPAVHVLTNSRAFDGKRAGVLVGEVCRVALRSSPRPRVLLRGDSTLRGHLLEEYTAVRDALHSHTWPPLLLVPALPTAGRVTLGGVHLLDAAGQRTPLHETEYARDGVFAYRSARLLDWAEERSGGFFRSAAGVEIGLRRLRAAGPSCVRDGLAELAKRGEPAVCVPDAETLADVRLIAAGLRQAELAGTPVVARAAPTFAAALAGTLADVPAAPPPPPARLLVVCGSYVETSTRQLAELIRRHPNALIEIEPRALASFAATGEVERAAALASTTLERDGLAVVATPRTRSKDMRDLASGVHIAEGLAAIVAAIRPEPEVVVAKGGITSAVVARLGLRAEVAKVVGPLAPGVALWEIPRARGASLAFAVFPGNVGDERALADVVDAIRGGEIGANVAG